MQKCKHCKGQGLVKTHTQITHTKKTIFDEMQHFEVLISHAKYPGTLSVHIFFMKTELCY